MKISLDLIVVVFIIWTIAVGGTFYSLGKAHGELAVIAGEKNE